MVPTYVVGSRDQNLSIGCRGRILSALSICLFLGAIGFMGLVCFTRLKIEDDEKR